MKDSAIVYRNFIDAVKKLPAEMQGEAYGAYLEYAFGGEEYHGDNYAVAALFMAFKSRIDADKESYEATCTARSEAGKRGAEKRWQSKSEDSKAIDEDSKAMANDSKAIDEDSKAIANNGKAILPDGKHMAKMADIDIDIDIKEKDVLRTSKEKAPKHKQGTYGHVLLTDDENQKLFDKFGEPLRTELINYLDQAIEEKGYKYKSHYLTIAKEGSWVQEGVKKMKRPKPAWQAEKEARRGTERGTDYSAFMNPPEDIALPFNDSNDFNTLDALAAM